ncbi:hypothetical protein KDD17_18290 [Sulfitobacter albidus]|uniref:Uncharacterized protein n=1 Tax=Sulfitobacter albidus TaxID=2829501 RepID=A0A975JGZ0_9RHOB|nr:hypothetical protein [Sulfitobacter albidus]QUJ78339.1 hypothetical protein KDD17_18290 [Sulfitobacter albidus]
MSSKDTNPDQLGDWQYLGREIWRRSWQPFKNVPFVFYVVLAIICLGGLGIWVEVIKGQLGQATDNSGLLTALSTFFPALIGSASLQLILSSTGNSDKILVSFSLLACFVSFFGVVLITVFYPVHPTWSLAAAIWFGIFAVWFWWFTNGDELTYQNAPIDAAAGGNTARAVKGNLSEFKVD